MERHGRPGSALPPCLAKLAGRFWPAALITRYAHLPGKEVRTIKQPEPEQVKRMNLNVPVELHNRFKAATASQGLNMTDVLMQYIQSYVSKHGQSNKESKGQRR